MYLKTTHTFSHTGVEWPCTSSTPPAVCWGTMPNSSMGGGQKEPWRAWKTISRLWNDNLPHRTECNTSLNCTFHSTKLCWKNENNYYLSVELNREGHKSYGGVEFLQNVEKVCCKIQTNFTKRAAFTFRSLRCRFRHNHSRKRQILINVAWMH